MLKRRKRCPKCGKLGERDYPRMGEQRFERYIHESKPREILGMQGREITKACWIPAGLFKSR
jgi:hypothetical protein